MKISIIIPVYNLEKYVGKAIESCLAQDYKDIEIIVVNDGSKDNSEAVVKSYCNDPRLIYIRQENGGVSSARNTGIKHATGDFITFLDGDDYLSRDTVSSNVQLIRAQSEMPDWVLFPMIRVDEEGNALKNMDRDVLSTCKYENDEKISAKDLFMKYERGEVAPCVCAAFFARDFFDVKFPPGRYEDTYVFLALIQKHPRVLLSKHGYYAYVDRNDSFIRAKFDANKWNDYTRTRIMHLQTGLAINPSEATKYKRQASKTYYNLVYLKNKFSKDAAYARPLQLFNDQYGTVDRDLIPSLKCFLKSILSRIRK